MNDIEFALLENLAKNLDRLSKAPEDEPVPGQLLKDVCEEKAYEPSDNAPHRGYRGGPHCLNGYEGPREHRAR